MKEGIKKILNIILGIILLLIILFVLILLSGVRNQGDKNKKTDEPEINIEFTGNLQEETMDEEEIPDSDYYSTVEEAMRHAKIQLEDEEEYQKEIDRIVASFENENYLSVFFISVKGEEEICDTFAKFKIKEIDGKKKYTFLISYPSVVEKDAWYYKDLTNFLGTYLKMMDFQQEVNIDPQNTKIAWGMLRKGGMEKGENIKKLRINGKKPDVIAEYEEFGETWYFWYYADIGKDTSFGDITYTLGREE